ncbi:MAG: redoxin domain-containing protein [Deltaproteobacteria bacterium]|nr:redoxin domain-containing protein [Deltaproteobacteria bacterium]
MLLLVASLGLGILACRSDSSEPQQHYPFKGTVVALHPKQQQATISHDAIPGYMGAMTMPFSFKRPWVYEALAVGDTVQATLVIAGDRDWLDDVTITRSTGDSTSLPPTAMDLTRSPQPGGEVPNFSLVNQDGKAIQLHQYHGKVLLLTFIYTRCPLPDFCPKMVGQFADAYRALRQIPSLLAKTHLLCVSFDHTFDTPGILHSYGAAFAGSDDPTLFTHWEFSSGTATEVQQISQFFGLVYVPETGEIAHSLRTAVISPKGTVIKVYTDNSWTVADILHEVESALAG